VRHSVAILRLAALGLTGACGAGRDLTVPDVGELTVRVATGGDQLDPDGYTLTVDGGGPVAVTVADTLALGELDPGEHRLELGGLAANCFVAGLNPLTITVVAGSLAQADFQVSCTGTTGAGRIVVRVVTTGPAPDPDGYVALVDPLPPQALAVTDAVTFEQLTAGEHAVRLDGVAPTCEVRDQNPRVVEVTATPVTTLFEVSCWPAPSGAVVFARRDPEDLIGGNVFLVNADGTGLRNLTNMSGRKVGSLGWSPDYATLAFEAETVDENGFPDGGRAVYLLPRGGAQPPTLLAGGTAPVWSPEGSRILLRQEAAGLAVVTVTSGQVDTLASPGPDEFIGTAAWSPNGGRVAFVFIPPDFIFFSIELVDANGANRRTIVDQSRLSGDYVIHDWQPGGSKLLVTVSEGLSEELYLVDTTASVAPLNLTQDPADEYPEASWSPDGSTVLFIKRPAGAFFLQREIYTLRLSDRALTKVSPHPSGYVQAAWSPDGTHVVYVEQDDIIFGPSRLFIVNPDGTGLRRLTAAGQHDAEPDWAP
jgi:Tol biopolymer transport system component